MSRMKLFVSLSRALLQPARRALLLRASRLAAASTSRPTAASTSRSAALRVAPCCSQRVALCCPTHRSLLQPARRTLLQPARRALLPCALRPAAALLPHVSRPAARHSARPAALSNARPALQPAERPAQPEQPSPTRATPPYLDHQHLSCYCCCWWRCRWECYYRVLQVLGVREPRRPTLITNATLLVLLLLLVEVLLGVMGVLLVHGVLVVRQGVLEVLLEVLLVLEVLDLLLTVTAVAAARGGRRRSLPLPNDPTPQQLREWVLQRARLGGGGFVFLRTAQRRQQSQQETFSLHVLSELFPQRCVAGSVEAAALGASNSAAALGASESAAALGARSSPATGPSSPKASHTFTLDSGASRCFFRDCTTLTPLAAPVPVSLADHTRGPVFARASTILPCPAVSSGSLSGLHLPMFSTNLVSNAAIQDVWPLEISYDSSGPAEGVDPAADDTVATCRSPRLETTLGFPPRPSLPPPQPAAVDSGTETTGAEPRGVETEGEGSGGGATWVAATGGPGAGQPPQPDLLETLSPQAIHAWIVWRGSPGDGGYGPAGAGAASPGGTTGAGGTGGTAGGAGGAAGAGGTRGAAGAGGAKATSPRGATCAGGNGPTSPGGTAGAGGAGGAVSAGGAGAGGTGGAGAAGPGGACTGGAGAAKAGGAVRDGGATGAAGSGGTGGTAGAGGARAAGAGGIAGAGGAWGAAGAAGSGGARGTAGARGAGAGGTGGAGAAGAGGASGAGGAGGTTGARGPGAARASGAACAGGAGGAAGAAGAGGAGAAGAGGAGVAGTALRIPFFSPQPQSSLSPLDSVLRQVLGLPSSTGLPLPLLCPPTDQSQPQLLPGSLLPAPAPHTEAIAGEYSSQWETAMDAEMDSWKSTGTYINEGVDFFQTFSPTPKMTTLWVLLHVAAQRDYELHSLDFSTAFPQGSLHEEIWLRHPPGFTGSFPAATQWSLRRPVYGLRQASREWHDTLRTTLAALGFVPSSSDPLLFLRTDTTLPPFKILVCVDDLVFAIADTKALALVKAELHKRYTCTDQGELCSYLGLQITRDRARRTITLTQSHMVHQVLQRFGFQFSSPQPTPLSTDHSLSAPPSDESVEPSGPYQELVGCLMYLMTCTRPDLAYLLSLLAVYVAPGFSGTQDTPTLLGCEAEIYVRAMAAHELRWLTYLLTDLGEWPRSPLVLYVENKAMLSLCHEQRLEHRTKHIALHYFLARPVWSQAAACAGGRSTPWATQEAAAGGVGAAEGAHGAGYL
ncbi:unnamed protein product, partial [Closterium sp. NIES-53]